MVDVLRRQGRKRVMNSRDSRGNGGAMQRLSRCTSTGSTIEETGIVQQRSRWRVPTLERIARRLVSGVDLLGS